MELPKKRPEQTKLGVEIDKELFDEIKKLCKDHNLKFRQAVEYGLDKFKKDLLKIK